MNFKKLTIRSMNVKILTSLLLIFFSVNANAEVTLDDLQGYWKSDYQICKDSGETFDILKDQERFNVLINDDTLTLETSLEELNCPVSFSSKIAILDGQHLVIGDAFDVTACVGVEVGDEDDEPRKIPIKLIELEDGSIGLSIEHGPSKSAGSFFTVCPNPESKIEEVFTRPQLF